MQLIDCSDIRHNSVGPITLCEKILKVEKQSPNRHFPNLFSGHKNCLFSISFILRIDFKLSFRVHPRNFWKYLLGTFLDYLDFNKNCFIFYYLNRRDC